MYNQALKIPSTNLSLLLRLSFTPHFSTYPHLSAVEEGKGGLWSAHPIVLATASSSEAELLTLFPSSSVGFLPWEKVLQELLKHKPSPRASVLPSLLYCRSSYGVSPSGALIHHKFTSSASKPGMGSFLHVPCQTKGKLLQGSQGRHHNSHPSTKTMANQTQLSTETLDKGKAKTRGWQVLRPPSKQARRRMQRMTRWSRIISWENYRAKLHTIHFQAPNRQEDHHMLLRRRWESWDGLSWRN